MKKILITVLALLCCAMAVTGCSKEVKRATGKPSDSKTESQSGNKKDDPETTTEEETESKADIKNDKPVKLYYMDYGSGTAELITEYKSRWSPDEDLATFGAFISGDKTIDASNEIEAHKSDWNAVNSSEHYQIGYEISFEVSGETRTITILSPKDIEDSADLFMGDVDTETVTGYLGAWVYDDYHQDGGFYVHVYPNEFTKETLLTSIKLRPTPKSGEIKNLVLRAFSYSSELEFDSEGHYNGNYGYEIRIKED